MEKDEKPEWDESFDEWVKRNWGKYPPFHPDELEVKWKKWKEQIKEEEEEEEKEEKEEEEGGNNNLKQTNKHEIKKSCWSLFWF